MIQMNLLTKQKQKLTSLTDLENSPLVKEWGRVGGRDI